MKLSSFNKTLSPAVCGDPAKDTPLPAVDQFAASEFFFGPDGSIISDVNVMVRLEGNPELQQKLRQYLVEKDIQSFDESTPDKEIFDSLSSQYKSKYDVLRDIEIRTHELDSSSED